MKKVLNWFLIFSFIIAPFSLTADISATIDYLQNQTQNAWITQSLAAVDVANLDTSYIDAAEQNLMQASKYLLALAATDSQDADTVNSLAATVNSYFNNGQLGEVSQLNDDFWGLLALAAVSSTDNIPSIKNFIINNQGADGGWSWMVSGDSDTNDTAAAAMALLDAGLTADDPVMVNALGYLQSAQNADGGFGYDLNSDSDGASTAWVVAALNKAGIEASTWQIDQTNQILFLQSLEQADGSYLWMPSDEQSSVLVTTYALLALVGSAYPVNYIDLDNNQEPNSQSIRIEGLDNTICLADNLQADTVFDLLVAAAAVCDFEYIADDSPYGIYVSSIDGLAAEGMNGWQYWVNWQPGNVGVTEYQLADGDQVIWGYGGWPMYPAKMEANLLNENDLAITAQYFNETWQPLVATEVFIGTEIYTTDANGQISVTLNNDGVYPVYVDQTEQYIRSNKEYISIGNGISRTVDLTVNIDNDPGGEGSDQVSFMVSQSNINFGELTPGQIAETIIQLTNTGDVTIYLEASVLGDDVLVANTSLDQSLWEDFNANLITGAVEPVNVRLSVPGDSAASGVQDGQLIFWAIAN